MENKTGTADNKGRSPCEVCDRYRRGLHTAYEADDVPADQRETGPSEYGLVYPNEAVKTVFAGRDDRIFECPLCHQLHLYRRRTPGGSDDAMRTNIHEYLDPVNPETAVNETYKILVFMRKLAREESKYFSQGLAVLTPAAGKALEYFRNFQGFPILDTSDRRIEATFTRESIFFTTYPAENQAWSWSIAWEDITRVCYKCSGLSSDIIFIFVPYRPESGIVRVETENGRRIWQEIIRRKLFDAELAVKVAIEGKGLYCWPQVKKEELPPEAGKGISPAEEKLNQLLDPDLSILI